MNLTRIEEIRIVHVTTVHPPYDTRILRRECVSLATLPGAVVYLLNAWGVDEDFRGVRIRSCDRRGGRLRRFTITLFRAYKAAVRLDADVYHLHDPDLLLIALFLKRRGHRVIFDCHENYVQKIKARYWIPGFARGAISRCFELVAGSVLPKVDYVIAATDSVAAGIKAENVGVVRNLPDVSQIEYNADFESREPDQILYTGGLTGMRGIEQVVRGLVEHCAEPWRLVILGKKNEPVADRLGTLLDDHRISYRGVVAFEEVVELMAHSALGVVCNQPYFDYQNALPNKLFEYMAAGLPVVCSSFPLWADLVEGHGAGVVCDAEDPKSIADACAGLLRNPLDRRRMGESGRHLMENEYSWEQESMRLKKVYKECLDGR